MAEQREDENLCSPEVDLDCSAAPRVKKVSFSEPVITSNKFSFGVCNKIFKKRKFKQQKGKVVKKEEEKKKKKGILKRGVAKNITQAEYTNALTVEKFNATPGTSTSCTKNEDMTSEMDTFSESDTDWIDVQNKAGGTGLKYERGSPHTFTGKETDHQEMVKIKDTGMFINLENPKEVTGQTLNAECSKDISEMCANIEYIDEDEQDISTEYPKQETELLLTTECSGEKTTPIFTVQFPEKKKFELMKTDVPEDVTKMFANPKCLEGEKNLVLKKEYHLETPQICMKKNYFGNQTDFDMHTGPTDMERLFIENELSKENNKLLERNECSQGQTDVFMIPQDPEDKIGRAIKMGNSDEDMNEMGTNNYLKDIEDFVESKFPKHQTGFQNKYLKQYSGHVMKTMYSEKATRKDVKYPIKERERFIKSENAEELSQVMKINYPENFLVGEVRAIPGPSCLHITQDILIPKENIQQETEDISTQQINYIGEPTMKTDVKEESEHTFSQEIEQEIIYELKRIFK